MPLTATEAKRNVVTPPLEKKKPSMGEGQRVVRARTYRTDAGMARKTPETFARIPKRIL